MRERTHNSCKLPLPALQHLLVLQPRKRHSRELTPLLREHRQLTREWRRRVYRRRRRFVVSVPIPVPVSVSVAVAIPISVSIPQKLLILRSETLSSGPETYFMTLIVQKRRQRAARTPTVASETAARRPTSVSRHLALLRVPMLSRVVGVITIIPRRSSSSLACPPPPPLP
ncbi:hypothetical protein BDZ97DRAFT_1828642, partial [Flammula alnicola]